MDELEIVTSTLIGAAWAWVKMVVLFFVLPGVAVGLICRYLLKLRGKIVGGLITLGSLAGCYYLFMNYEQIYNWLI